MDSLAALLREGMARLEITVDAAGHARLLDYILLLKKWSAKTNLIAKKASDPEIAEHVLDSLTILPFLPDSPDTRLADVGSGAGFPGFIVAAARPNLTVHLIEPRQKRAAFLRQGTRSLHLPHVTCHECRLEDISPQARQTIAASHITSRAVDDLAGFLHMIAPWLAAGRNIICMKGRKWPEELAQAQEIIVRLALSAPEIRHYRLPFSGAERFVALFTAQRQTDAGADS
ncbi:MAG: 16S rRNA (guanine(527)-N(7))-methyltransferase RsmG [Desulfobulbaceae bacterium]|jgi:16S rRNA (guanine527-N7)-methyltransferase|nr:16S rRNA (guanine(527)-N(7))-methyltransferase RsmG [Desulfobulbaceae bacterium]